VNADREGKRCGGLIRERVPRLEYVLVLAGRLDNAVRPSKRFAKPREYRSDRKPGQAAPPALLAAPQAVAAACRLAAKSLVSFPVGPAKPTAPASVSPACGLAILK